MYNCRHLNIKDISELTISTLELSISRDCNMSCKYCYLHGDTFDINRKFTRWDDLFNLLQNVNISNKLTIGIATGEVFLDHNIDYLYYSIKKLNKISRFINTDIEYRIYSNGSNATNIINFMDFINSDNATISISYDGKDSYRLFKKDQFIDLDEQLQILANSKYAKDFIFRYAVYDNISNMLDTFKYLYNLGFKNVEYYILHDYNGYTNQDLIDEFAKQLEITLFYFDHKDFNIFNKDLYFNSKYPTMTCGYGNTIAIDNEGRISICSSYSEGCKDEELTIDLLDYKNLPKLITKFQNDYVLDRTNLDCMTCKNHMCTDCCSYKAIVKDDISYRINQQCKLRHAELAVYDKLYGW